MANITPLRLLNGQVAQFQTGDTISTTIAPGSGGGGGANVGTAVLNFGAFPGKSDTSIAVTGQAGIVAGSIVEAWIRPVATAEHSADEHIMEATKIVAGNIVAATGFTIYGVTQDKTLRYGTWNAAWMWS